MRFVNRIIRNSLRCSSLDYMPPKKQKKQVTDLRPMEQMEG